MANYTVTDSPSYLTVYEFEKYDHMGMRVWLQAGNWMVSIYASIIYLLLIYFGQQYMENRKPFQLRHYLVAWNVFLTILSLVVCIRMLPELVQQFGDTGFYSTLCYFGESHNVATSFWGVFFCFSKMLDFGDTLFLVLSKKPVIFLHWYHHVSVAIFCMFVADSTDPATRWFAVINSFIHFIMYFYYSLKAMKIFVPRSLSMCITIMQIVQMIYGVYINVSTYWHLKNGGDCDRPMINIYTALLMYSSYLILFAHFFYNAYLNNCNIKSKAKSD